VLADINRIPNASQHVGDWVCTCDAHTTNSLSLRQGFRPCLRARGN
jgi:hypothetical protein